MLEQFKWYLMEDARIQTKCIPCYLRWISECYAHLDESLEQKTNSEGKQQFLRHTSRSHEDWQVKTGGLFAQALQLLSCDSKQPSPGSAVAEKEWIMIEDETRRVLRLRHLSLSTEKSYIIWLRQFCGFVFTVLGILILPRLLVPTGIWLTPVLAEGLTGVLAVTLLVRWHRNEGPR